MNTLKNMDDSVSETSKKKKFSSQCKREREKREVTRLKVESIERFFLM